MKKIIFLSLMIAVSLPLVAQHDKDHHEGKHREVTEIVSDLSAAQKRKIDNINKASRERVATLRARQKAVRDSIMMFIDREGDQSAVLYPLFDREAAIQANIDREMYAGKLRIDEVLTKEQRDEVRRACAKDRSRNCPKDQPRKAPRR